MINCQNLSNINETFNQVTKNAFEQTPNLTETFDQLKMSSEIWSTDPLSILMPRFSGCELEGKNYKMHLIFVSKMIVFVGIHLCDFPVKFEELWRVVNWKHLFRCFLITNWTDWRGRRKKWNCRRSSSGLTSKVTRQLGSPDNNDHKKRRNFFFSRNFWDCDKETFFIRKGREKVMYLIRV